MKKLLVILGLIIIALLAACAREATVTGEEKAVSSAAQQTGLWVAGEGKVTYTPDIALLTLGIEAEEKTVAKAQEQARQAMNKVNNALISNGVAEKDIQTQQFSIQPVYDWREKESVLIAYRVSNIVQAKLRAIEKAGSIIDAVAEAGGDLTRIQSIGFTIDNPNPLYQQAREKAVADAQAKAKQIASLLDIGLGKPTYISESTPYLPVKEYRLEAMIMETPTPPTPISPGELELTMYVQVVYAIK